MRRFIITAITGLAVFGGVVATSRMASAQEGWGFSFGNGGFGFGYGNVAPAYAGYGGYFGNGGHDAVPHWHQTTTPYGSYNWYGLGAHDFQPHAHQVTPYSYQGYSASPWGYTTSFYPRYPGYTYAPW